MFQDSLIVVYSLPLLIIWALYLGLRKRTDIRSRVTLKEAAEAGMLEPASLHPLIDPVKCLGWCLPACLSRRRHSGID